jgi:putative acyl-CoA dehydrogenase
VWDATGAESEVRTLARAARIFLTAEVDAGHLAQMSTTSAGIAALAHAPRLAEEWLRKLCSRSYDATMKPVEQKAGALLSLAFTERQAGTDFRLLNTEATSGEDDAAYRIDGHKWFVSAPMSDAYITLAQTREGVTCFLVPRHLTGGDRNGIRLVRLKDKLGTRSLAAGEIEFNGASGFLLGKPGGGLDAIREVTTLARLDDTVIAAALMRAALAEAVHHCRRRMVGGRVLIEQPLMARVLADVALDVVAATSLVMRIAIAMDRARNNPVEAAFARLMTPVAKYWITKIAPGVIAEMMESIGGNAVVEESRLPRLYRDSLSMVVADGPGNVLCLDVLKMLRKSADPLEAVIAVSEATLGGSARAALDILRAATAVALADEGSARVLTEQLALTVAAATMHHAFPAEVGDAFLDTRLGKGWRTTYGMLDSRFDTTGILDFVCPSL